jgi:hypothetical protein
MNSLDLALSCAARGFRVFPVGPDRKPWLKQWPTKCSSDEDQLIKWFTGRYKKAQVSVATGAVSGVIVVDIDNKHGAVAATTFQELVDQGWPKTMTVRTQTGGLHLYYKNPGDIKSVSDWRKGIDIRAEGGQVVAPGSQGKDGDYSLLLDITPVSLPLSLAVLLPRRNEVKGKTNLGMGEMWVPPETVKKGERDDTFFRYASSLQAREVSEDNARAMLVEYYESAVEDREGFSLEDALDKVQQVYNRYASNTAGVQRELESSADTSAAALFGTDIVVETDPGAKAPNPKEVRAFKEALSEACERNIYVEADAIYYDRTSRLWKKSQALAESLRRIKAWLGHTDAKGKPKLKTVWEYFAGSDYVERVDGVGFYPNDEPVVRRGKARYLNAWDKPEATAEPGPVGIFTDHLLAILDGNEQECDWVLDWMAHLVQYPGEKIGSTVLISSTEEGLGKSILGKALAPIIGTRNLSYVGASQLKSGFNDFMEQSTLVIVEEFSILGRWETANKLKDMVTNDTVRINAKFRGEYNAPNHVNFLFFSNYPDAAALSNMRERRSFIHHSDKTKDELVKGFGKSKEIYYKEFWDWVNGMGPAYLADYLLKRDISQFHSWGRFEPPLTESKKFAVRANLSEFEQWIEDHFVEHSGPFCGQLTSAQLIRAAAELDRVKWDEKTRHEMLRWMRVHCTPIGTVKIGGKAMKISALVNSEKWAVALHDEKLREYQATMEQAMKEGSHV